MPADPVGVSISQLLPAYGVLALSQPFDELIGPPLPVMLQTVLLPFKDKIVYDGLTTGPCVSFGSGIRRFRPARSVRGGSCAGRGR